MLTCLTYLCFIQYDFYKTGFSKFSGRKLYDKRLLFELEIMMSHLIKLTVALIFGTRGTKDCIFRIAAETNNISQKTSAEI